MLVLGTIIPVHLVVGGHHRHCAGLAHGGLERLEINLADSPLVGNDVYAASVGLLVVQGEVLYAGGGSRILHSLNHAHRKCRGQGRVFAQILVSPTAHGKPLDVDGGAQHHVFSAKPGLYANSVAVIVGKVRIPGCGKRRSRREIGGGVQLPAQGAEAVSQFLADTERTVGILDVLDSQARNAFGRHNGLGVKHHHLLFQGHLGDDLVNLLVVLGKHVLR